MRSLLIDLVYLVVLLPYLVVAFLRHRRLRAGLSQRFGFGLARSLPAWSPGGRRRLWIHGVSVGEILAARAFIDEIRRAIPEVEVVLSTTTVTGQEVARRHFPECPAFYFPLDFSWALARTFAHVQPSIVVLIELEIWPNFLDQAFGRGVPVALVNGRISRGSYDGYRLIRRLLFHPLKRIPVYCVQNETYADRFVRLGVARHQVRVTGSMKYDNVSDLDPAPVRGEVRRELGILADALVIIGGSTHAPEEEIVLSVYARLRDRQPGLRLILAPRHPSRARDIVALVREAGFESVLKTELSGGRVPASGSVIVMDTLGELARTYAAGDLVFVGGSLVPHGGQNMIEPAGLGRAVYFGPHTHNFKDSVALLLDSDAARRVADAEALHRELAEAVSDPERARAMGRRAREVIHGSRGAAQRNVEILREILDGTVSIRDADGEPAPVRPRVVC